MEVIIAILGGSIFTSFVYIGVYFKLIRRNGLEMLEWFLLSIATFNGIIFGFVMWATHEGRNLYIHSYLIMNFDSTMVLTYIILNIIFSVFVILGWNLAKIIKNTSNLKKKCKLPVDYSEQYVLKRMIHVAWLMLIIAVFSYLVYTRAYGGFLGLLNYSKLIRSGVFAIENRYSFLQRFGSFSFFSSYIFYSLLIDKENKKINKKSIFIGFIFALSFSLYVLYSWVGRVGLALYIATFLFGHILYSYSSIFTFIRKIIIFCVITLFLLIFSDAILGRSGGNIGIIELFTKELSFPFVTFYSVINSNQYRWFIDVLVTPLYLFPMKIWSGLLNIETASSFNTFLLVGARKGEFGVYGETPVDMLSFSFMQGNILGVLVVGLIWGITLYILQRLIYKISIKSIRSIMEANVILNIGIMSVLYGDPQHIIVGSFDMIIGFIMVSLFLKIRHK